VKMHLKLNVYLFSRAKQRFWRRSRMSRNNSRNFWQGLKNYNLENANSLHQTFLFGKLCENPVLTSVDIADEATMPLVSISIHLLLFYTTHFIWTIVQCISCIPLCGIWYRIANKLG
jgi:hypothetical protein